MTSDLGAFPVAGASVQIRRSQLGEASDYASPNRS